MAEKSRRHLILLNLNSADALEEYDKMCDLHIQKPDRVSPLTAWRGFVPVLPSSVPSVFVCTSAFFRTQDAIELFWVNSLQRKWGAGSFPSHFPPDCISCLHQELRQVFYAAPFLFSKDSWLQVLYVQTLLMTRVPRSIALLYLPPASSCWIPVTSILLILSILAIFILH